MARLLGDMVEEIDLEVDVLVFKDPTVNAWAYPNGTVAVQTGLLAAMENEAQLAAIMGHEIAHAIVDNYLSVRPPRAAAEILARYVGKHLNKKAKVY